MKFKETRTGEILTTSQVRKKFSYHKVGDRVQTTFFPRDPQRWDDVLLQKFGLERVDAD